MDPITIALSLAAKFAPQAIKWLGGGDKSQAVAAKMLDIATTVTGQPEPQKAMAALEANPELALQYQKAVMDNALELERLAAQNAADINTTMRAEAAAEHWPTYSWRPFIGFCFGLLGLSSGLTAAGAYISVMFFGGNAAMLGQIPGMLGSEALVMGTMAPILGVAAWYRGKMQADPNITTLNRG